MIQGINRSFSCVGSVYSSRQALFKAVVNTPRCMFLRTSNSNCTMEHQNWDFSKFPAVKPSLRQKFEELLSSANDKKSPISSSSTTPIENRIRSKLDLLKPTHLYIRNDSHKHRHHKAMQERVQQEQVPESHFYVEITSDAFNTSPLSTMLERHRVLYWLLSNELSEDVANGGGAVHALQLVTRTPVEADKISKR